MRYADFRPQIKSGDLISFTHRGWFTSFYSFKVMLVRLFQLSEYCHVGTAIVMGGRVWVLEAVTPGVRLVPLSNLLPCYHVAAEEFTQEQIELGLSFVGDEKMRYSIWECVKGFLGRNDYTDNNIQCAELVNLLHGYTCLARPEAVVQYCLRSSELKYLEA